MIKHPLLLDESYQDDECNSDCVGCQLCFIILTVFCFICVLVFLAALLL